MRVRGLVVLGALLMVFVGSVAQGRAQTPVTQSAYLEYARGSADWTWDNYDDLITDWRDGFDPESIFGYRPPGRLLEMAVIYAYLFETEGEPAYAERAKRVVLQFGDYRSQYPQSAIDRRPDYADGVPALPDFFRVMRYIKAFETLDRLNQFSLEEVRTARELIAHSMEYLLRTVEWGTMNRTMLRAESLAWAVRALPDHPRAEVWRMQDRALADDNWGNWEIEDATIYHGIWLYALMGHADVTGRLGALLRTPEMYYYAQYFLNLMAPIGMVPDFGDANWLRNWQHYLVFFEAGAAAYDNPQLKWAANVIAARFVDFTDPTNVGLGYFLLDCYRWGADGIAAEMPNSLSTEVMEDVQGKKIVFRNGWEADSTYLLLNYRDEGDGGLNFRDYLRDTIPGEEEKMTHGHADENSITLLMSGGSVLLHDGGYRDYMPSGPFGAYRQDYFHNRLAIRPEKIWMGQVEGEARLDTPNAVPGQAILDFLHNAGSYRRVRTQKIDFLSLPDVDYSRSRMIDDGWGFEWDRVIVYLKDPEVFVVFDIVKARTEEYFTIANLWHTRQIVEQGDHWYDTVYDQIGTDELPQNRRLLIHFPDTHFRLEGTETETRHYQEEILIHQTTAKHFELGETEGFVTVLVPHEASDSPGEWANRIRLIEPVPNRAGLGVVIEAGEKTVTIGVKQDLRMDMSRDWRRPRYTYDAGRLRFNEIETNGDFVFASSEGGELRYTITNLTKATYGDQVLYEGLPSYFYLAFDGSRDASGVGKMRYWRGQVQLEP